jgi:hypothetical protein
VSIVNSRFGNEFPETGILGDLFWEVLTGGVEFGIVEMVVETGAALAGRVFIWEGMTVAGENPHFRKPGRKWVTRRPLTKWWRLRPDTSGPPDSRRRLSYLHI